jgi:hypothetical protein
MEQNIESSKFIKQVDDLYATALEETIALLKNSEKGRYIAIPNWEDEVAATSWNDVPISIWGVGLNDDNHICVKAFVNNVGYGYSEDDFPEEWTDITVERINTSSYPELFRFVADNIDKAMSREDADKVEWD